MPYREDDVVAPRDPAPANRNLLLTGGFVLAGAATLAVLLTDDPHILKVAVIGVAWAFVLATFAAGRRGTDRVAAAAREAELRAAYEAELDREVAARREYELELELDLRREAEESMRTELDALRGEIAGLSGLRDQVARVADLRDDVAALMALRQDLGQLAELRADMGRLRVELTEQLSSEMLVERIVMRTQASRLPADAGRADDGSGRGALGSTSWADDVPPRELTGGWPAIRLDEPRGSRLVEPEPGFRYGGDRPAGPPTAMSEIAPASISRPPGPPPTSMSEIAPASIARPPAPPPVPASPPRPPAPQPWQAPVADVRRPPLARPPVPPPVSPPPPSPLDWLAARSLLDAQAPPSPPEVPPVRRRATDGTRDARRSPVEPRTTHRPAVAPSPPRTDDRDGSRTALHDPAHTSAPGSAEHNRLAEILAENGVSPSSGGRRRRRYRDGDEPDDVLARVLGRS